MFGLFTFVMAYVKNFGAAIAVRFSAFAFFFMSRASNKGAPALTAIVRPPHSARNCRRSHLPRTCVLAVALLQEGRAGFPSCASDCAPSSHLAHSPDDTFLLQACYIVCAPGAGAIGGLLASGILKIDSIGSISGWRAIFWVEGIISMGIGIISWFLVQDRPSACKWLTPEERELAEFRLVAENVGQYEAVDKMHSKAVWSGIFNVTTIGKWMR